MLMAHSSLMGSDQPSLHQGRHSVTQRQEIVPHGTILTHYLMNVAEPIEPVVSFPVVGPHYVAGFHGPSDRRAQAPSRGVCDTLKPDSANTLPILLCRNDYQRFSLCSTASFPRLLSTDIHLVNLDGAGEPIPPRPDHGPPQLMQPCPGGFIATQSQNPLHSSRTGAVLLAGHQPDGAKPQHKRFSRPFKDGSGNDRGLIVTSRTPYQPISRMPPFPVPAPRALETIRPPQLVQILSAGLLGRKSPLQLQKVFGVILHTLEDYILWLRQSRGYPKNKIKTYIFIKKCSTATNIDKIIIDNLSNLFLNDQKVSSTQK
jgi:hypothetical protein